MPRENNFDLLRLLFASIVVLRHCYDLSLNPAYSWIPHLMNSRLAVEGFFAMSGCLIVGSYEKAPSMRRYFENRARRLLPGYWAALLLTLVLAFTLSTIPAADLLRAPGVYRYMLASLAFCNFLHPSVPGLFAENPVMSAANGALWTIKVEVLFYLLVPLIVWCCDRLGRFRTLGGIFLLSVLYRILCSRLNHPSLEAQLPGQLCFFVVGSATYYYYPWFKRNRRWMWAAALASYVVASCGDWIAFRAIGVALGVMCLGLLLPCLPRPAKHGDFSYGTYVLHYPVVQTFISLGMVRDFPYLALLAICLTIGLLAVASWHLVEKPFLRRPRARGLPQTA